MEIISLSTADSTSAMSTIRSSDTDQGHHSAQSSDWSLQPEVKTLYMTPFLFFFYKLFILYIKIHKHKLIDFEIHQF